MFCRKLNLLSQLCIFVGVKVLGNVGNKIFRYFQLISSVFRCILIILSKLYCIWLLTLLCREFGIAENYALFGVDLFCLKFGWCKENDILHVCCHQSLTPTAIATDPPPANSPTLHSRLVHQDKTQNPKTFQNTKTNSTPQQKSRIWETLKLSMCG